MEIAKKQPKPWRDFDAGEVEAAHRLYMELGPSSGSGIVGEMISLGYRRFRLKDISGSRNRNFSGLEKQHGWRDEWIANQPKETEAVADEPNSAEQRCDEIVLEKSKAGFRDW